MMKTHLHPSDREVLVGLVEPVTYQNAENGFCVIRVKAPEASLWLPFCDSARPGCKDGTR